MIPLHDLKRTFASFGCEPTLLSTAPGRINLLGEHVDYLGGRVLPAAIDRGISVLARLDRGETLEVVSVDFGERVAWQADVLDGAAPGGWQTYLWGVLRELRERAAPWSGGQLVIAGDVPLGAGLSSSAALEVALLGALLHAADQQLSGAELARLARKVENDQVGIACGIMDPFVSVHGRAGHVLDLDCESLEYRTFRPELPRHAWVLIDSMVQHDLGDRYNRIRAELESAEQKLDRGRLIELDEEVVGAAGATLTPSESARAMYVTSEARRTAEFVAAALAGDEARLGALLQATHRGLSEQMQVSTPELDAIVEFAGDRAEWAGGRMIGGGFGGCVLNLVERTAVDDLGGHVRSRFAERFGIEPEIYPVMLADGARVEEL